MHRRNLGDMLVAANLIDEVQMQIALAEQKQSGKRFGSTLVELKFIDENVLAAFLSKQIDVPCISLLHIEIPKKVQR
ncbi:MAG TPA: MSHA biogenesis protein MshE, partial [Thermoanaerobaculia bacterium]|nr:MSHA biogenesis protein MshE [Thermoanaerobaculia bacterium]